MAITVSAKWVHEKMKSEQPKLVLFDTRFSLGDPSFGLKTYKQDHIVGAQYLDLNKDLSGEVHIHGGGHPLPEPDTFAMKVGAMGVSNDTTVVVYDDGNGMFAARAWWTFYYMGHEHVYVLENGITGWKEDGYETTNMITDPNPAAFIPHVKDDEIVHMEEVRDRIGNKDSILIDSRAKDRYLGKSEPMYAKSGHIPGAKNYFWQDVLNEEGSWKDVDDLQEHFKHLDKNKEIVVSCGSGVSACPNIIGLKKAGFTNVKLYPGSFSDWISYSNNEVEKNEK